MQIVWRQKKNKKKKGFTLKAEWRRRIIHARQAIDSDVNVFPFKTKQKKNNCKFTRVTTSSNEITQKWGELISLNALGVYEFYFRFSI